MEQAEDLTTRKATLVPFHWQLEFPDVYFNENGQPLPPAPLDQVAQHDGQVVGRGEQLARLRVGILLECRARTNFARPKSNSAAPP